MSQHCTPSQLEDSWMFVSAVAGDGSGLSVRTIAKLRERREARHRLQ
jgi:hypothetical protein